MDNNNIVSETQGFTNRLGDYVHSDIQSDNSINQDQQMGQMDMIRDFGGRVYTSTSSFVRRYPYYVAAGMALLSLGIFMMRKPDAVASVRRRMGMGEKNKSAF